MVAENKYKWKNNNEYLTSHHATQSNEYAGSTVIMGYATNVQNTNAMHVYKGSV